MSREVRECNLFALLKNSMSLSTDHHIFMNLLYLMLLFVLKCGPGSSVGIATDYGLDGPGSYPGGDGIFHPFRPALGPTQPPVKWIPGLSRG